MSSTASKTVRRALVLGAFALVGVAFAAPAASAATSSTVTVSPTSTGCTFAAPVAWDSNTTFEVARAVIWDPATQQVTLGNAWIGSLDGRRWFFSDGTPFTSVQVPVRAGASVTLGWDVYWNNGARYYYGERSWAASACNGPRISSTAPTTWEQEIIDALFVPNSCASRTGYYYLGC